MPRKVLKVRRYKRQRPGETGSARGDFVTVKAHISPFADAVYATPTAPSAVDWSSFFPRRTPDQVVRIVDVGCGFGSLLFLLSRVFPSDLVLGLEIRPIPVDIIRTRLANARDFPEEECKRLLGRVAKLDDRVPVAASASSALAPFENASVELTNAMRYLVHYFTEGQLHKMFFCFPDPHFKKKKHHHRILNEELLAVYAFVLADNGTLYHITDVEDLHDWTLARIAAHPLFEVLPDSETKDDPALWAIQEGTDEASRVTRTKRDRWWIVARRIPRATAAAAAAAAAP